MVVLKAGHLAARSVENLVENSADQRAAALADWMESKSVAS